MGALAAAIRPHENLHVEVEAHTDSQDASGVTQRQAQMVRSALSAAGVSPDVIIARGLGNSRPLTSNATASGRAQNRRTEIIIAGDAIGSLATWDRTYTLAP
jgi:OOP family OmpA-OmpF porin